MRIPTGSGVRKEVSLLHGEIGIMYMTNPLRAITSVLFKNFSRPWSQEEDLGLGADSRHVVFT